MFKSFCCSNPETLVIGSTGKTGRRVAARLEDLGHSYRAGSRSADIPFDWEDSSTWGPALKGIRSAYVTYFPDLAVPGAVEKLEQFVSAAREQGLRRIVLLSGRGEEEAQRGEQVVQASGLEWTIVRASWFSQNFSENFMLDPIRYGHLALPIGDVTEPFVDADDIADVAVAALTEDGHAGQVYEVTGPRLMRFEEVVAEISEASGREVTFERVSMDAYDQMMIEVGIPDDFRWLVRYLFTTVMDGRNEHLTDGIERALGRPPKDFKDYARETAATGVWEEAEEAAA